MSDYSKLDNPAILSYIFYPRQEKPTPLPPMAKDISFSVADQIKIGCRFFLANQEAPNLIFFHGNGETVGDYDTIGPIYTEVGINFLITDFRGYGWSDGRPTVSNMFSDGKSLFDQIRLWLKENELSGPIFLMGRSLGSACAIDLAKLYNDEIKGLVIESGFADTIALAANLGIDIDSIEVNEDDGFQNAKKIADVTKATLILHGARDQLIPPTQGERLQAESGARSKEFQIVPGADHNSLIAVAGMLYFETIKKFMDKVTGTTSWRKRRKKMKQEPKIII